MKLLVKYPEEIYSMTTIGKSFKPVYQVAVNPDSSRIGDCYFKVYDSLSYTSAEHVARIRFDKPQYVKEHKGLPLFELNSKMKSELNKFLDSPYSNIPEVTNWDYAKYAWNLEKSLLDSPTDAMTPLNAYLSGYFDTVENLKNPDYLPSTLSRPDYTNLI